MDIPRHWRLKAQRYRLEGSLCPVCGRPNFPPRPACPDCSGQRVNSADAQLLSTTGWNDIPALQPQLFRRVTERTTG
jgi:rubredoxin-like zinc ribbon protein